MLCDCSYFFVHFLLSFFFGLPFGGYFFFVLKHFHFISVVGIVVVVVVIAASAVLVIWLIVDELLFLSFWAVVMAAH